MAIRKFPINVGIIFEGGVFYSSDMEIAPVLELAKFSISFTQNLVKNARLLRIVHEPSLAGPRAGALQVEQSLDADYYFITTENVLFNFISNKAGEKLIICLTYPSAEDLRSLEMADLTKKQLDALAACLLSAYTKTFRENINFDETSFGKMIQENGLRVHELAIDLHEDLKNMVGIIFTDEFPHADGIGFSEKDEKEGCQIIFACAMNESVPVASKFFENMEGFFRIKVDSKPENINDIIQNLISAQLSTIFTTSKSLASTMIREIEIKIEGEKAKNNLYISFYPIKNNYSLVFISKGNPDTLKFFTQAMAEVLKGMDVLDNKFVGEINSLAPLQEFINNLPSKIEAATEDNLDSLIENIDLGIVIDEKRKARKKRKKSQLDKDNIKEILFWKNKDSLFNKQKELNDVLIGSKIKNALKKIQSIIDLSKKIKNEILVNYYKEKQESLKIYHDL
ncbi:MAG: hypothetical protein ACTSVI_00790 [Promethearchaeota archaeon]